MKMATTFKSREQSIIGSTNADEDILVEVDNLVKIFGLGSSSKGVRAVDGINFKLPKGASIGLVGESGSGKTTLGRLILGLTPASEGRVRFGDVDLETLSKRELRQFRRHMQMVFQNPYDSLNPRWRVRDILEEPLILFGNMAEGDRIARVEELMTRVRLDGSFLERYPHQLSGGQQQRIGIARALATNPDLVVLDEPTSALDTVTRVEILELLNDLRRDLGLTYIFISHDLAAVQKVCDSIIVMYLGKIVETAPSAELFADPQHPYTRSLLSALLEPRVGGRKKRARLVGDPPSPINPPSGCRLHPRCPIAVAECARKSQHLVEIAPDRQVACMRIGGQEQIDWPPEWITSAILAPYK